MNIDKDKLIEAAKSAFERKTKYITFKIKDCLQLPPEYQTYLHLISEKIAEIRSTRGKGELEAVVIESHQPEYEAVWQLVQGRIEGKPAHAITSMQGDSEPIISDAEIVEAFINTHFGSDDHRKILIEGVRKTAINYHNGFTLTQIIRKLGLGKQHGDDAGANDLTEKGLNFLIQSNDRVKGVSDSTEAFEAFWDMERARVQEGRHTTKEACKLAFNAGRQLSTNTGGCKKLPKTRDIFDKNIAKDERDFENRIYDLGFWRCGWNACLNAISQDKGE